MLTPEQVARVRRNNANYASGVTHGDLMIVHVDSPSTPPRAIYRRAPPYRLVGASLNGKFEAAGTCLHPASGGRSDKVRLADGSIGGSLPGQPDPIRTRTATRIG